VTSLLTYLLTNGFSWPPCTHGAPAYHVSTQYGTARLSYWCFHHQPTRLLQQRVCWC